MNVIDIKKEDFFEEKQKLCEICKLLFDRKLVSGTDGNVSMRVLDSVMLITPSGVCKGMLKPEDIIVLDFDGNILVGHLRSSKEDRVHIKIYQTREDVNAIIHTHPPASTSFAILGKTIPDNLAIELPMLIGPVALAPLAMPGTKEVPDSIDGLIEDHKAILLQNHGLICYDKDIINAFNLMDALENVALTIIYAKSLGVPKELSSNMLENIHESRRNRSKK